MRPTSARSAIPHARRAASKLYRGLILPGFMKAVRGTYRGRVLTTRTLMLFGAEDALLPRDALFVSAGGCPDTTVVEFVPGGAHYLVDDNPAAVVARIREFLGMSEV